VLLVGTVVGNGDRPLFFVLTTAALSVACGVFA